MKVRALNSFSDSVHGTHAAGDEFWLPVGVDWLSAGLVEVVTEPEDGLITATVTTMWTNAPEPKPARKKKG